MNTIKRITYKILVDKNKEQIRLFEKLFFSKKRTITTHLFQISPLVKNLHTISKFIFTQNF